MGSDALSAWPAWVALLCGAAAIAGCGSEDPTQAPSPAELTSLELTTPELTTPELTSREEWTEHRDRLNETVWGDERLAGQHEATLVALWDALLATRDDDPGTLEVLTSIEFGSLTLGTASLIESLDHGIDRHTFGAPITVLDPTGWAELVRGLSSRGYRLIQSEWHHAGFSPASVGTPARSIVSIVLHVVDEPGARRFIIEGELEVGWAAIRDARGHPIAETVDATRLAMFTRTGSPPFRQVLEYSVRSQQGLSLSRLHPILLSDLDRDGYVDIVSIGARRVLWNLGTRGFRDEPLLDSAYLLTETGVIADLNGDGWLDLLAARGRGDLALFAGDERGRFTSDPVEVVELAEPLRAPSALTVGDIDNDGDLDVWLAQYKPPYLDGQMPTPYYDANDGHPAYLLKNDGAGRLTAATDAAGLAERRFRRTYASSFVDLDGDRDLDLVVVSDFSGIDLYHNDGHGKFDDANDTIQSDRHLFGMSSSFADFDLDGRLDFFVAGMASTTARRLDALGLGRADRPDMQAMRMRMAFGNRMYLAGDGGWSEPEFRQDVARTGWTWGTTALDFDNDGDPDLFAANGHESGESTSDYCTNFWTHDIFDGDSTPDQSLAGLFGESIAQLGDGGQSWDGYQKNHLLMNRGGRGFVDIAFLFGVADEFDSRSALSADFDRDGRMDLAVVEDMGEQGERLHLYRNQLESNRHWIGVELRDERDLPSPIGASVTVRTARRTYVGRVMTGETLMGQHASILHFGLGDESRVESIEVGWISGATRIVSDPAIDRYHWIRAELGSP